MGDLVMSFPLLAWLKAADPTRPLWVLAEPGFFEPAHAAFAGRGFFPSRKAAKNSSPVHLCTG